MKKITLLGANLNTGNMGVGALMLGAVTCVRHAWPDAAITLLDYDDHPAMVDCKVNGVIVQVPMIPMRFSKKLKLQNNIARLLVVSLVLRLLPRATQRRIIHENFCLEHLDNTDLVLSIAGGDSFSDIYGFGRFAYIVLPLLWALAMRKKLILMPQTIGPFKNMLVRRIAAFIMKRAEIVYARDNESLTYARKLMGRRKAHNARFCYDMGFVLCPEKSITHTLESTIAQKHIKTVVGLNISGLLCMGGYTHRNMFRLNVDYSDLIRSLITFLITEKKSTVALIPHVFGASGESDVPAAKIFFNELQGRFGSDILLVQGNYDPAEIKYIIGRCDFFIGSRMHACIAALSQGVPAVGIAYSRKFSGVLESIGMDGLVTDPRKSTKLEILAMIGRAFDARESMARQLQERMLHIKGTVINLLNEKPGTEEQIC